MLQVSWCELSERRRVRAVMKLDTLTGYDRRENDFDDHAGGKFL